MKPMLCYLTPIKTAKTSRKAVNKPHKTFGVRTNLFTLSHVQKAQKAAIKGFLGL